MSDLHSHDRRLCRSPESTTTSTTTTTTATSRTDSAAPLDRYQHLWDANEDEARHTTCSGAGAISDEQDAVMDGGRLWKLAGQQVAATTPAFAAAASSSHATAAASTRTHPSTASSDRTSSRSRQWVETFMLKTASRADPDSNLAHLPPPSTASTSPSSPHHHPYHDPIHRSPLHPHNLHGHWQQHQQGLFMLDPPQDPVLLMHSTGVLAHKRVRVVQLLLTGLVGWLLGWLGNVLVGTSCHFVSTPVVVGANADTFTLHFGLWKYSPADSALNGYTYCYPYTGSNAVDAPIAARIVNLAALLTGTYSLTILWWYLIVGQASSSFWRWAIRMAFVASLLQVTTAVAFFQSSLCRNPRHHPRNYNSNYDYYDDDNKSDSNNNNNNNIGSISSCTAGPAALWTLMTAAAWFILGWELYVNHIAVVVATTAAAANAACHEMDNDNDDDGDDDRGSCNDKNDQYKSAAMRRNSTTNELRKKQQQQQYERQQQKQLQQVKDQQTVFTMTDTGSFVSQQPPAVTLTGVEMTCPKSAMHRPRPQHVHGQQSKSHPTNHGSYQPPHLT